MKKKLALVLSVLILTVSLFGCGSSKSETAAAPSIAASQALSVKYNMAANDVNYETDGRGNGSVDVTYSEPQAAGEISKGEQVKDQSTAVQDSTGQSHIIEVNNQQKIIFTGQLDYETLYFDKTRTDICNYVASLGGFRQSSSVRGGGMGFNGLKSATYVFRIPKAKYEQSFIDLRRFGTVIFEQSNGEDVTDQYFDTEARLKSLRIQEERLLELLKKAIKMEDILKLEKELQTTNYEIENLTGTLKKWDSLVEYSTLTVNINEVEQLKPVQPKENDGFFHRISSGFVNSVKGLWNFIQDTIVGLAAALPILIPLAALGYLAYRMIRKRTVKAKKTLISEKTLTSEKTEVTDPSEPTEKRE